MSSVPQPRQPDAGSPPPFACVAASVGAELRIDFGVRGCFGGSDNLLQLRHLSSGFWLAGFTDEYIPVGDGGHTVEGRRRVPNGALDATRATDWLHTLEKATDVPLHLTCESTTKDFATISWRCDGMWRSARFKESEGCEPYDVTPASAVAQAARGLLASRPAPPASLLNRTESAEVEARWSSLYDKATGMRLRHDPIEPWERDGGWPPEDGKLH